MQKKKMTKKYKRRLVIFGIPSVLLIIYFCVTLISYAYNYTALLKEEKKLNNELNYLKEEKKNLKNEIQKLNDPDYIVRFAKEKYLYSTTGEYVLKIDETKEEIKEEDNNSYILYGILGAVGFVLCLAFLKKNKATN